MSLTIVCVDVRNDWIGTRNTELDELTIRGDELTIRGCELLSGLIKQSTKRDVSLPFSLRSPSYRRPFTLYSSLLWETAPPARFMMLGQTHVNGWSRVIVSQNGGSTSYIFPLRLEVLQWSRHLFNYWKNKKTIIEKFLILLIWNLIYIDHRKITWIWS